MGDFVLPGLLLQIGTVNVDSGTDRGSSYALSQRKYLAIMLTVPLAPLPHTGEISTG